MSEFDPYHRWLGIAPGVRPPNHYALLGIPEFEEDLEVIASAADRQMSHVRSFQSGVHAVHSQQLLNELAAARVCLLQPERKQQYDERLRQDRSRGTGVKTTDSTPPRSRASATSGQAIDGAGGSRDQLTNQDSQPAFPTFQPSRPGSSIASTRSRPSLLGWVLGGVGLAAVAISIIIWQVAAAVAPKGALVIRVAATDLKRVTVDVGGNSQSLDAQGEVAVDLPAGHYQVRVQAPAHEPFLAKLEVTASKSQVVRAVLRPIARVTITCPGDRAQDLVLTFDGETHSIPPSGSLVLACDVGEHLVKASQGEWSFERSVVVTANQNRLVAIPGRGEQRLHGTWIGKVEIDSDAMNAKLREFEANPLQKLLFQGISASLASGKLELGFLEHGEFSVDLQMGPLSTKATGNWRVVESSPTGVTVELQPKTGPSDTRRLLFIDDDTFTTDLPGEARSLGRFRCERLRSAAATPDSE
ncbi:MAG: hypothetical protein U1A77_09565 [Pirellulales bacterium]